MHHPQLKPGLLLRGKWRLDEFLGRGGMSSVYAATHRNGMRGAIKVLHRELNENEVVKKRFMREGYVANKVEHPGSVRVLDDDVTEDGLVFLVMELLEGITLKRRWIECGRHMDLPVVVDIVDQVLDVLESAHKNKIVHRDLKPDNIFLLANGAAKVLDFGIARVLEATLAGSADTTSSAAMMGTPAFMPPEQALAHWDKVDGRADLFAVGATAYTVLTGKLIHSGSTMPELLIAAATRRVDPIRSVMPDLDESIAAVLDRALRFEIAERWPDARSMRLALLQAKTRVAGSRTVRLPMQARDAALLAPPSSAPTARVAARTAAPATVLPTTTPMDSSDDPTVAYAVTSPDSARSTLPAQPLSVSRPEGDPPAAPAAPAASPAAAPHPRGNPRTLQSEGGTDRTPAPASGWDATPVRLQERMLPEHIAHLAKSTVNVRPKTSRAWLTWLVGAVTSAAVLTMVLIVRSESRDTPGRSGAPAVGASAAPPQPTTTATAEASAPSVRPVMIESAVPSATPAVDTSASADPGPSGAPRRRGPGTCVAWSEFNGTCIKRKY